MRGLVVSEQSEDFTADPVELFFDLAFVFAFSQIVHMLVVHPDWEHVGKAGLIFLMLWMPWLQFTWSANAVPGNQRSVRLAFLIATAASVPMAAAVETAFDGSGALFAISLAVIFLMGLSMIVSGLETGSAEYRSPSSSEHRGDADHRRRRVRAGHRSIRGLDRCDRRVRVEHRSGWRRRLGHPTRPLRRTARVDHHRRARRGDRCPW